MTAPAPLFVPHHLEIPVRSPGKPLLVRTPAQQEGESPLGFVIRASEANGYDTPRRLFALAGATRDETFTVGLDMDKVAAVLGHNADQVTGYKARGATDVSRVQLNGHPVAVRDFDLAAPKVCPECVHEHGFIPAWTDLELVDACPVHRRILVTECPVCGDRLSWFRSGLLRCQCGASLADTRGSTIGEEHVALLALVIARATESVANVAVRLLPNSCGMPTGQFDQMTLRGMLAMVRSLARLDLDMRKKSTSATDLPLSVAARAGVLFSRWPENLFMVLRELVPPDAAVNGTVTLRRHLEGLYRVILKDISAASDIAFLRDTVSAFFRALKEGQVPAPERERPAVAPLIHAPVAVLHTVLPKKRAAGPRQRPQPLEGARTFSAREVARRIELPVSVLQYLRRIGVFEVHHRASRVVAFHEADVIGFEVKVQELLAAAAPCAGAQGGLLPLGSILNMNFKFEDGKGELIAAILEGRLPHYRSPQRGLRELLLIRDMTLAFIERSRADAFGDAVTPAEASKILFCDPLVIPTLVGSGHLTGQRHDAGLRVTRGSVQAFASGFCTIAEVAMKLGTSSRALQLQVKVAGVEMLFFERGYGKGAQPFVRRSEVGRFSRTLLA